MSNRRDYTYDKIGQLKTALGYDIYGEPRRHEQFGYAYDAGGNLAWRTNNNLKMQFKVNGMNQLTNVSRTGTMTVFGALASRTGSETVTVSGTGLSTTPADLYTDAAWASQSGATLADGQNTWTAKIVDYGVTNQQVVTTYMPASANYGYDGNGNLTNDGLRSFEYDFENQLTNVFVASGWRSEFRYDGLGRRRVRREYTWSGGAWSLTNEVRYVYDGRLVMQERDGSNNPTVTYTRGLDLSGTFQGAGGIGGLLARSDSGGHAFYHSDANGNVIRLMKFSGGSWQIAAFYRYDRYGNILAMTGPLASANLYRFSSKEIHPNSGLVYYLYRYYDPNLQRWINRDPIAEVGGINIYGFVDNNPITFVDPHGELPIFIPILIILLSTEAIVNAPGPGDETLPPYKDAPDPIETARFCINPGGALLGEALGLAREQLGIQDIPRGPKGGKKHTPGRDHQTKSGQKKKEQFQKKAEQKRNQQRSDLEQQWDKWNTLSEEQRKLLPDLKPSSPDPRCK